MNISALNKEKCCGCALCASICPKGAIHMTPDELGNLYPSVDEKCIDCGKCLSVCSYNGEHELKEPIATFAACRTDKERLTKSSSGGVFAAIAESLNLSDEWYVAGCILDENLVPKHLVTSNKIEIEKMYGSKYVQSNIQDVYVQIKDKLKAGYKVLFSGTPCQVSAIQKYTKNHENLYTIEVICHGVTSPEMFDSYLLMYNKKQIREFIFRDKKQGWSFNNLIFYKDGRKKKINHRLSSYMTYFLNGETYRDCCYSCPFAKEMRGADLTIGDYWGIIKEKQSKGDFNSENGVSCLLTNSEKGRFLVDLAPITKYEVPYESIRKGNEPLNHPSTHTNRRFDVFRMWMENRNWIDVDKFFLKKDYSVMFKFWSIVPVKLQHLIRVVLGKR